jgi:carbonic anhydrase
MAAPEVVVMRRPGEIPARRAMITAMALVFVAAAALVAVSSPARAQEDAAASFSMGNPVQHSHGWFKKLRANLSPTLAFMQATDSAVSAAKDASKWMLSAAPPPPPAAAVPDAEEEQAEPAVAEPVSSDATAEAPAEEAVEEEEAPQAEAEGAAEPPAEAAAPGVEPNPPGLPPSGQWSEQPVAQGGYLGGAQVQVQVSSGSGGAEPAAAASDAATAEGGAAGGACAGERQSPINIELDVRAAALPVLGWELAAGVSAFSLERSVDSPDRRWLRAVRAAGAPAPAQMAVGGVPYVLASLEARAPSEHAVGGVRADLELQLVHELRTRAGADSGRQQRYLVVSARLVEAPASAPAVAALAAALAPLAARFGEEAPVELGVLLMALLAQTERVAPTATNAQAYYQYAGSFSAPPCTEGVEWVVLKNPLPATRADIDALAAVLAQAPRPLQPLNGRAVWDSHVL